MEDGGLSRAYSAGVSGLFLFPGPMPSELFLQPGRETSGKGIADLRPGPLVGNGIGYDYVYGSH